MRAGKKEEGGARGEDPGLASVVGVFVVMSVIFRSSINSMPDQGRGRGRGEGKNTGTHFALTLSSTHHILRTGRDVPRVMRGEKGKGKGERRRRELFRPHSSTIVRQIAGKLCVVNFSSRRRCGKERGEKEKGHRLSAGISRSTTVFSAATIENRYGFLRRQAA